ncbi:TetR/AcrR family transcriptional regulator [uncultured Arthrobacter sp.]|uniref:TetR/AcrR family transcriptional regulator n=1 Tax=uncultured Arthrobacter sp. TaxID=114050 RepID=UPI0025D5C48C|nr:TetR/AcrR family transcriptional regulator [uncultured Arthrobacter sp.]
MSNRERILQTARRLAIEAGSVPSLDAVAAASGVSKGGLMHHFRSRAALLDGIAAQAIEAMDEALAAAAEGGNVTETWLRLSMSREDADLYRALLVSFTDSGSTTEALLRRSAEATERWERLIADEVGDPVAAAVIRLLGDGMVMNSVTGDRLPPLESVLEWLKPRAGRE